LFRLSPQSVNDGWEFDLPTSAYLNSRISVRDITLVGTTNPNSQLLRFCTVPAAVGFDALVINGQNVSSMGGFSVPTGYSGAMVISMRLLRGGAGVCVPRYAAPAYNELWSGPRFETLPGVSVWVAILLTIAMLALWFVFVRLSEYAATYRVRVSGRPGV